MFLGIARNCVSFISYCLFNWCSADGLRSIFGSSGNLVEIGSVRGEPVHAVKSKTNNYFFRQKPVKFYEITRGIGSVRHEPVHYGEPVRAVMIHILKGGVGVTTT